MSNKSKSASPGSCSYNDLNVAYDTETDFHQWTKMPEYVKLYYHTVVPYKDTLYAFGGYINDVLTYCLIAFNVKDKSWSRPVSKGTKPAARLGHSAVVYGDSMFIFGGQTHFEYKNDLFQYNFNSSQWSEWKFAGKKPSARSAHGAAIYDNKLWIYAGQNSNSQLNDMWCLNLKGEYYQWKEVEQKCERPISCSNFRLAMAVARDCMFVFSVESELQITNSLFEFNFKTQTWRRIRNEHVLRLVISQPPSRRYGHTMVHHDRFLYVFGGSTDSTLPNDVHCYDLDSQVWSIIKPEANSVVPPGRIFHASAVISDAMYIFGGSVDKTGTYRFRFSSYPKCTLREDYCKFFNEKQFCDIQFIVGPEEVKVMAHIAFVAARSKYLRTKILAERDARQQQRKKETEVHSCSQGANQEPLLEVRLPSANPEAFEIILKYIYTDSIELKEPYTKNIIILITDIYQLADLFQMPRLAQDCIQYLNININKINVLEGLHNADKNKIQMVKDHCMHYLIKETNFNELAMTNEFGDLDKPLLVEIIRKKLNSSKKVNYSNLPIEKNVGTTLESDMAVFLESIGKDFCDISLVLEGQVIMAHKSILSARTQYFQAMFRSFMPPDNTVNISIGDILPSVEALQSLLRYIYYGETKLPPQDALYLFQAPNFYGLSNNRLYSFCKYSLEHNITYENVLQTLEASDYTNFFDIKEFTLKFIVKDFSRVTRLPIMSSLSRELLLEIIRAVADSHDEFLTRFNINTVR